LIDSPNPEFGAGMGSYQGRRRARRLHRLFGILVMLKGVDGAVDLVAGVALLLVRPGAIAAWTTAVTWRELSEDPQDFLATHLKSWGAGFGHGEQLLIAAYLLFHGAAKVTLAASLLLGKRWAYPAALAFLAVFVAYAGFRLAQGWSWLLAGAVLFDLATIALVAREWQAQRPR
jgi:uncharacterized membrane protein